MEIMVYNKKLLSTIGFYYEGFWKFPKILWSLFWFYMATFNLLPIVSTNI